MAVHIVQNVWFRTNSSNLSMTYIFWFGIQPTFTWVMPNKCHLLRLITFKNCLCSTELCSQRNHWLCATRSEDLHFLHLLRFSLLKFYVIGPTGWHLFGIAHVKVAFIPLQKLHFMLFREIVYWLKSPKFCEWTAFYYYNFLEMVES